MPQTLAELRQAPVCLLKLFNSKPAYRMHVKLIKRIIKVYATFVTVYINVETSHPEHYSHNTFMCNSVKLGIN